MIHSNFLYWPYGIKEDNNSFTLETGSDSTKPYVADVNDCVIDEPPALHCISLR